MAKYCDGMALDRRLHIGGGQGIPSIESLQALAGSRLRSINPNASANELKTTLMSHSIIHADAYFAYFNKIWGIPKETM
jgi:hypothetical protein